MNAKASTTQAIVAYSALRALSIITTIAVVAGLLFFGIIWTLAYSFSPWWWIFLLPLSVVVAIGIVLHVIAIKTIHLIHRHPFTESQRQALEQFADKVTQLAQFRETPLPIYALTTLRDIIRHHDARTVRAAIEGSTTLKDDFLVLEKHFGER